MLRMYANASPPLRRKCEEMIEAVLLQALDSASGAEPAMETLTWRVDMNPVDVGAWSANWAWSLPLIGVNVVSTWSASGSSMRALSAF